MMANCNGICLSSSMAKSNRKRLLTITMDEYAMRKTHKPNSKEVDVSSLHQVINEILKPSPTATTIEGFDQAALGSHLESSMNSSCLQELVKDVNNIYSELLCKCSGGGDATLTLKAVLATLSCYSWEAKMVVALAAFAVIYGEWREMVEQTDPFAESIKLLKHLPDKSKLSKIWSLIDAIVKSTNTVVKVAAKGPLPEIQNRIQSAVCLTMWSIVVCTSQIMNLDHEYPDLSELTIKLFRMDTDLAMLLLSPICRIEVIVIQRTHVHDGKKIDVSTLHKLINKILGSFPTNDQLDSLLKTFKNNSEELAKAVYKICYQLRCKSWRGEDLNSKTVPLFLTLSRYSWEAKLVLALAAFAVIYTEWSLMGRRTNPLAESIKLLKQSPDKSKLPENLSLPIDAILKVTNTVVEVIKVHGSRLPKNISTQIETAVSWTVGCIIACTTRVIGSVLFTETHLSELTEKVDGLSNDLCVLRATWRHSIEEKIKVIDQALQNGDIEDPLSKLIYPEAGEKPIIENTAEVAQILDISGLKSTSIILANDFAGSNKNQEGTNSSNNQSLHAIGDKRNPYEQAIGIIGATLAPFDEDNLIPRYGFGDATTKDQSVFSFCNDNTPSQGFEEVLKCYKQIVPKLTLAGPTSFAPAIDAAIDDIVKKSGGKHHVLVIITDGQVNDKEETVKSINKAASSYALSIVVVGVGDGPWDGMNKFADDISERKLDNFQFVNFTEIMSKHVELSQKEAAFALAALIKIPKQYKKSEELGHTIGNAKKVQPPPPPSSIVTQATESSSVPCPV